MPLQQRGFALATAALSVGGLLTGLSAAGIEIAPHAVAATGSAVVPPRYLPARIGTALVISKPGVSFSSATATPSPATVAPWVGAPLGGVVSPSSFWYQEVSSAPLAANSAAQVASLNGSVVDRYGGVAAFNAHQYGVSFVTAAASTPLINVTFDDCQGKGYTPAGLSGVGGQFTGVPIPDGALAAEGTDAELSVYDPATDQLWEFWDAQKTSSGWSACWGGRIDAVSHSQGIFSGGFGANATGTTEAAGVVTLAEAEAGMINHAIAISIPSVAPWNQFSWPAQRSDGSPSSASPVMEGTRFRLNPNLTLSTLGLTPLGLAIARAAQTYGFVVTDQGGAVAVSAESGSMQQAATGADPWAAVEQGVPDYSILRNFPWSQLQALPKDYGKP